MASGMKKKSVGDWALGWLGLWLLGLTGWAVQVLSEKGRRPIDGFLAGLTLGCVAVIGWLVDRLSGLPRVDRRDSTKGAHPSFRHP